ncbi:MAG: DUF1573 domain-containing protein [Candidatus Omnitrophota bacterium]
MVKVNKKIAFILIFIGILFVSNAFSDIKSDIYSKLKCCPCKESFETCTCPEAKQMKAYIEGLLEAGLGKDEIFYKIAKKFTLKVIIDEKVKSDVEKRLLKEAGDKRPEVSIEPIVFDFGKVSKKQIIISKTFKVINKGTAPLAIKNVKSLCSCVSVSLTANKIKSHTFNISGAPKGWQVKLKPQESAQLDIIIDLLHSSVGIGKLIREVQVTTDDPIYPEVFVRVEADVGD